jgi:hypothetical protein
MRNKSDEIKKKLENKKNKLFNNASCSAES